MTRRGNRIRRATPCAMWLGGAVFVAALLAAALPARAQYLAPAQYPTGALYTAQYPARGYLFPKLPLGIDVNGWLQNGYTYGANKPPSRFNGPLAFNDRNDDWQMNQMYVVVQRQINPLERVFDVGGRIDMLYGTDARYVTATGLEKEQNGSDGLNAGQRFYQLAFPQFYGEVGMGPVSFQVGHFYSFLGYESVQAPQNFFYSHSYMRTYAQPFTFTGALVTWRATQRLSFVNGVDLGWNVFSVGNATPGFTNRGSYVGGFNWDNGPLLNLTVAGTIGNELDAAGTAYKQRALLTMVTVTQVNEFIQVATESDVGQQIGGSVVTPGKNAQWYGFSHYLYMQLTNTSRAGLRWEWFRDDDGARVAAIGRGNPAAAGGFAGNFYELAAGINWLPLPNVILRPEVRFDWFDAAAGITARPFDDGLKNSLFTAAMDAVVLW